jgi:hypothetical protein
MDSYDNLKKRTLSALADAGDQWLSPREIGERIDFRPRRSTWTYLNRLRRFGPLERRSSGKGTLQYRISRTGLARLRCASIQRSRNTRDVEARIKLRVFSVRPPTEQRGSSLDRRESEAPQLITQLIPESRQVPNFVPTPELAEVRISLA